MNPFEDNPFDSDCPFDSGNPFASENPFASIPPALVPASKAEYFKEYRELISKALYRTKNKDGSFGADMRALCNEHYRYVGNNKYCTNWYLFIFDDSIDKDGHKVDPDDFISLSDIEAFHIDHNEHYLVDRKTKLCHILASKSLFTPPKTNTRGRSLRVDPHDARLNTYIYPVIWKRTKYVNPKIYHNLEDEKEKRECRTKKTYWKNDYKRAEIYFDRKRFKVTHRGIDEATEKAYQEKIKATRINDEKHPLVGRIGFSARDVLGVNAIVVDLDNHSMSSDAVQDAIVPFTKMLINGEDDKKNPFTDILPNFIVLTGRGLQLWFLIDPVYGKGLSMVRQTAKKLCDVYEALAAKYCPILEVDRNASTNITGAKRMWNTKNSRALSEKKDGTYGYTVRRRMSRAVRKPYDIKDIMHSLNIPVYAEMKSAKTGDGQSQFIKLQSKKRHYNNGNGTARSKRLLNYLSTKAESIQRGMRNNFLFYAGTLAVEAKRDTEKTLYGLNSALTEPLSDTEVAKTAHSASRGIYHYATETIVKSLGGTEEEIRPFSLSFSAHGSWISNDEKKRKRAEKRDKRNKKVLEHLSAGKSIKAVSELTGLCRATVARIKAAFLKKMDELKERNKKIKENLLSLSKDVTDTKAIPCVDTAGYADISYPLIT